MNIKLRIFGAFVFVFTIVSMAISMNAERQNLRNATAFLGVLGVASCACFIGMGFDAHPPEEDEP